jgi:Protein of unknown function (DUF2867)
MRIPNAVHESRGWRIGEIVPDFTLLDVWSLPMHGTAEDSQRAVSLAASLDPANARSPAARALWQLRWQLGRLFHWDEVTAPLPIPGTNQTSLTERLPEDLRDTASDLHFGSVPFRPLYRTGNEFAAELSNHTVHGVLHLGWVEECRGRYRGEMAVYIKTRGRFGTAYMALINPFRHWIVYPALMRQIERAWKAGARQPQGAGT